MTIESEIFEAFSKLYDSLGKAEALNVRQRGQRIRRLREQFEKEHPKRIKFIGRIIEKSKEGVMDRDGIPVGTDISDEDDYTYKDEPIDRQIHISYSTQTIGGDHSGGGKTKFRLWLENVWLPQNPKLRSHVESLDTDMRRKMMKRLSFIVRRSIAQHGLTPNGIARIENDRVRHIDYYSGNRWDNPEWE